LRVISKVRGGIAAMLSRQASNYRDGEVTDVELVTTYASGDLACVVEVERGRANVGDGQEIFPLARRVTSLFRLEDGEWKLVHRHADPITTLRPASSVVSR
jgi:ketosteroid isomerase-like protein